MNLSEKAKVFEEFLKKYDLYIDYNGAHFTLIDNKSKIVTITTTTEEMHHFINGFNLAIKSCSEEIEDLKNVNESIINQNITNIKEYEKIIKNLENNKN